jgi:hypothetical protein
MLFKVDENLPVEVADVLRQHHHAHASRGNEKSRLKGHINT